MHMPLRWLKLPGWWRWQEQWELRRPEPQACVLFGLMGMESGHSGPLTCRDASLTISTMCASATSLDLVCAD